MLNLISVFLGGAIGATSRYLISKGFQNSIFPLYFGTFFSNILGCFLIGFIFALSLNKGSFLSSNMKLFLTTGFLGGLTTFSTFNLEVFNLLKDGKTQEALIYLVLSIITGLIFTYLGYFVCNKLFS